MTTFKMNEEWTEWTLADTGRSGQLCDTNRFWGTCGLVDMQIATDVAEQLAVPILSCSKRGYSWV